MKTIVKNGKRWGVPASIWNVPDCVFDNATKTRYELKSAMWGAGGPEGGWAVCEYESRSPVGTIETHEWQLIPMEGEEK